MKLKRSTRAWTATIVALCMLFAQLAVAAYVCPKSLEHSTAVTASTSVAMADCDSVLAGPMDPVQPNLCKAHCEPGLQSSHAHNVADLYAPALHVLWADAPDECVDEGQEESKGLALAHRFARRADESPEEMQIDEMEKKYPDFN